METPSFEGDASRVAAAQPLGVVDFIVHKLRANNLTYRQVALRSGMSKSRIHRALHPDRRMRHPLRVDEMQVVLDAMGISPIEATIAGDIINDATVDAYGMDKLIELATGIVSGLHTGLLDAVQNTDGVDWDDIKYYHGKHFQKRILEEVRESFGGLAARRDARLRNDAE